MTPTYKPEIKELHALNLENDLFTFQLPLTNIIKIGSHEYPIEIREDETYGTHVLWKKRRYPVEIIRVKQNRYEILFNDISYTFTIETPFSLERRKVLSSSHGKNDKLIIRAPMPGKIVEVPAREGAEVKSGEPVIILEAMKMQNEILSSVSGMVAKIAVKTGQNVMKDDILVEVAVK
jgi:glutaconyl-CoA/methylmalonyl-CoA decarboxylase subunit gamma